MAEKEVKSSPQGRITERDRLKFIGFDVFPGEAKELFRSDAEKEKYLAEVRSRHDKHDHLRESCTLLEERVSKTDQIVLAIASIIIILALALPWYSVYNEIVEEAAPLKMMEQSAAPAENIDAALTNPAEPSAIPQETTPASPESAPAAIDTGMAVSETPATTSNDAGEELITAFTAKKKIHKEYTRLSGFGGILALANVGSYLFSSGVAVILTVVLFLAFTLLCIALPIYNLYGIYGLKGDPDAKALKQKKMLRMNWIPLVIFTACLVLSFFGSDYSFDASETFTSIGDGYSPVVFLGSITWGVFISLACFILCAAKGAEI